MSLSCFLNVTECKVEVKISFHLNDDASLHGINISE